MGQLFKSFNRYNFKSFNHPTSCLNNYSMSGAKIAFILLVITMLTASASADSCCQEKGVPDICLGICMGSCIETPDEPALPDNLCTEYEPIARECCEKEKGK